jgi:predicted dehydrogenase
MSIQLGIIGTGGMANHQADQFQKIKGVRLVAACDVNAERVAAYASKYGIPRTYTDYRELLDDPEVDAVSVVTSDTFHAPVSIAALKAGKHVLCEKPLAMNYEEAQRMVAAAKAARKINMVQMSYRSSGAWLQAQKLIQSGKLGQIVHFEASYLQSWLVSTAWGDWKTESQWLWRLDTSKGSNGALGDIGVHIIDFATAVAGDIAEVSCRTTTFTKIKGTKRLGYTLDANDSAVIHCALANGALGVIHVTRFAPGFHNRVFLRVHGTEGALEIDLDKSFTLLRTCIGKAAYNKGVWKEVTCRPAPSMLERFVKSIRSGKNDQPDFARGAVIQKILDTCFESSRQGGKSLPV